LTIGKVENKYTVASRTIWYVWLDVDKILNSVTDQISETSSKDAPDYIFIW